MKHKINTIPSLIITLILFISPAITMAADYVIDTKGAHTSITFKVKHLGFSWLTGRFNTFNGHFSYDEKNPSQTKLEVTIETKSIDSNHAERDKHLRSDDFLDVDKYPQAKFILKEFIPGSNGTDLIKGDFTLHGITKPLDIEVQKIGAGDDPWGGYRIGFTGQAKFLLADFSIKKNLGPFSKEVTLLLEVEGVRQ